MFTTRIAGRDAFITYATLACLLGCVVGDSFAAAPGTQSHTMLVGGVEREFLLHVPATLKPRRKVPLVIVLHGGSGHGAEAYESRTGMSQKADREGFIVAYPQCAAGSEKTTWSAHMNAARDDVDFVRALLGDLKQQFPVDAQRVLIAGFSSGGLMAERLGVELFDEIQALAVVSGSFGWNLREQRPGPVPRPARPVSMIAFHGRQDKNVPYDGMDNGRALCWSVERTVGFWVEADGCKPLAKTTQTPDGRVQIQDFGPGTAGSQVRLYSLSAWGHGWPTQEGAGVDATAAIWDFFSRLPSATAKSGTRPRRPVKSK